MSTAAATFLAAKASAHEAAGRSELAALYERCGEEYSAQLWHQLTNTVDELVRHAYFVDAPDGAAGDAAAAELRAVYTDFVRVCESKLNALRLVQLCTHIVPAFSSVDDMYKFVEAAFNRVASDAHAQTYAEAVMAELRLAAADERGCLTHIEQCAARLKNVAGAERVVYARYYRATTAYYKAKMQALDFYTNGLLWLAYERSEDVPRDERIAFMFDMSMAALVGETIYNFGELLSHPWFAELEAAPDCAWIGAILRVFNAGDIDGYARLRQQHAARLKEQPALADNARLLREKVSLLAIMVLVFERPANERRVAFTDIAKAGRLKSNEVELVLMRALSLGLLKGRIDEIDKVIGVTWVQPRVLDLGQVASLKSRLDAWQAQTRQTLAFLDAQLQATDDASAAAAAAAATGDTE